MSLRDFQRALSELVASPELCHAVMSTPADALARYELTVLERRRLETVVRQPGMRVNCTLYRINRVTPIYSLLPRTCSALGDRLRTELDHFWQAHLDTDLQFVAESLRFAEHLGRRLDSGDLDAPFVADVLRFELALNELKHTAGHLPAEPNCLPPSVRIVRVAHDSKLVCAPPEMITAPSEGSYTLGESWILLVAGAEHVQVRRVGLELGRLLAAAADGLAQLSHQDIWLLIESGQSQLNQAKSHSGLDAGYTERSEQ